MKAYNILKQIYATLPDQTDKFTSSVQISSISASGTTVTVVTNTDHNAATDDEVVISDVVIPLAVTEASIFEGTLNINTAADTDYTDGKQQTATLSGANESDLNDTFNVVAVPNRDNIICDATGKPNTEGTGSIVLLQDTGYAYSQVNGLKKITVVDATSFTYEVESALTFTYNSGSVINGFRMTGAVGFDAAYDKYTEQEENDYWLFVSVGAVTANKDRKNNSDAIYVFNGQSGYKQELIHALNVYVFADASGTVSARPVRDDMEDIAEALIKSLCGFKPEGMFERQPYYSIVFESHTTQFYNKSVYCHVFNFQTVTQIGDCDTFREGTDVAFRDVFIDIEFEVENI